MQEQAAQGVFAVGVEAGGDQDELRAVVLQGGAPIPLQGMAEGGAFAAGRQGRVVDVGAVDVDVSVGVEGVLEAGADQHFRALLEDIDGAVAVVDVEVQDGRPVQVAQGPLCA